MRTVVLGAGGQVGRQVVDRLRDEGVDVVAASRTTGTDAYRNAGLTDAVTDADVVVDCLNVTTMKAKAAVDFFATTATNVGRAAHAAGAAVVCLSIANATDPEVNRKFGYYQGKSAQEQAYRRELEPKALTIVASTQWYELAAQMMGTMRLGPLALVPHMRCRPAAAVDVAEVVAREAITAARNETRSEPRVIEVAGPDELDLVTVARSIARQQGAPRWVAGVRFGGAAIRNGGLVPADPEVVTPTTLPEWVARQYPASTSEAQR